MNTVVLEVGQTYFHINDVVTPDILTVGELIQTLQKYDSDSLVVVKTNEGVSSYGEIILTQEVEL